MQINHQRQSGFSTLAAIGAFIGLGVVFLILFFTAGSSNKPALRTSEPSAPADAQTTKATTDNNAVAKEPPYIRIPENSEIYTDKTYDFMFAYPDSFGKLTTSSTNSASTVVSKAESALADQKPIGIGTAFLNGRLSAYVYKKADFKIVIQMPDISVAPTKTGNDITWKIVSRGNSTQDISIGDAYPVKTVKSQTGVAVFDFSLNDGTSLQGRWVFEAGDNYVLIALPFATKPGNVALAPADIAAYKIVGSNIARTVRLPGKPSDTSNTTKTKNSTPATTDATSSQTAAN